MRRLKGAKGGNSPKLRSSKPQRFSAGTNPRRSPGLVPAPGQGGGVHVLVAVHHRPAPDPGEGVVIANLPGGRPRGEVRDRPGFLHRLPAKEEAGPRRRADDRPGPRVGHPPLRLLPPDPQGLLGGEGHDHAGDDVEPLVEQRPQVELVHVGLSPVALAGAVAHRDAVHPQAVPRQGAHRSPETGRASQGEGQAEVGGLHRQPRPPPQPPLRGAYHPGLSPRRPLKPVTLDGHHINLPESGPGTPGPCPA